MKKVAIKSQGGEHGKILISYLMSIGGNNTGMFKKSGCEEGSYYYINDSNIITHCKYKNIPDGYTIKSLDGLLTHKEYVDNQTHKPTIKKLAIRSNGDEHGRSIIKYFISIGVENKYNFDGRVEDMYYYINSENHIGMIGCTTLPEEYTEKTLEELIGPKELTKEQFKLLITDENREQLKIMFPQYFEEEIDFEYLSKLGIPIRTDEEYKDKSFYLNNVYYWEIKTDSEGAQCLIPSIKSKN